MYEIQNYVSFIMMDGTLLSQMRLTFLAFNRVNVSLDWAGGGKNAQSDPFSRLFYLNSGQGRLFFSDSEVSLSPGHIYSIPSFESCRYVCSQDMDLCFIHYQAKFQGEIDFFSHFQLPHELPSTSVHGFGELFNGMVEPGMSVSHVLNREGGVRLILASLSKDINGSSFRVISTMKRFEPVFSYVEENLDKPLSLEVLSSLVSLHPTYFSNLFTQTLGMTTGHYIRKKRVDRAALLLAYEEEKLETIATLTGFSDAFHLSRVFKDLTGYPPSLFRKRVRGLE